jgi:hypothetical protein
LLRIKPVIRKFSPSGVDRDNKEFYPNDLSSFPSPRWKGKEGEVCEIKEFVFLRHADIVR